MLEDGLHVVVGVATPELWGVDDRHDHQDQREDLGRAIHRTCQQQRPYPFRVGYPGSLRLPEGASSVIGAKTQREHRARTYPPQDRRRLHQRLPLRLPQGISAEPIDFLSRYAVYLYLLPMNSISASISTMGIASI